jgi:hypothetical protein
MRRMAMHVFNFVFTAVVAALLFPAPGLHAQAQQNSAAQGFGNNCNCDISGTWYGGSDYQYLWTFTPMAAGRYYSLTQPGFDNHPFGYITWTSWAGELRKTGARTYTSYGMSYWVWDPDAAAAAGVDPTLPEVDIVHSTVKMIDCDTFTSTIDVYAGYFSFTPEKTPFVTPPDVDWLQVFYPGVTLVETYHRMPTACPNCPIAGTTNSVLGPDRAKLHGKKR